MTLHFPYTFSPNLQDSFRIEHAQKLETCRNRLREVGEVSSPESLAMIDAIQRLGIDHHFHNQIEQVLGKHNMILCSKDGYQGQDLHEVALRFRLLRQQGYHVPADMFKEFKDNRGRFNQELSENIASLMELYEASHLSIEGEDILDEAGEFSAHHLKACLEHLDHSQAKVVQNKLDYPYSRSVLRIKAMSSLMILSDFQGREWINLLLDIAKTDFNMVQSLHQKEILQVTKWWKDLGLRKELPLARDQSTKWYLESLACLNDPSLSEERIVLAKTISLIFIIDDIFDLYGTLDELTLFTQVVNRWHYTDMDQLPDCNKICLKALDEITKEISHKVYKKHGWNPIDSLRKTWASLCNAFLVEAKWFAAGEIPKPEEYLKNGIISTGVYVVLVHIFFLLGQDITKENMELVNNNPGIISSTATILRLWDDLGSAKDENQDGRDGSYVDCYMKEHQGITMEDARQHVMQMISKAWKQLNQEFLSPNPFPSSFRKASLNIARMVPLLYGYDKNYLKSMEEYVESILCERT
ncbi:hypothetical protein SLA2020_242970 [Shorea laevis]